MIRNMLTHSQIRAHISAIVMETSDNATPYKISCYLCSVFHVSVHFKVFPYSHIISSNITERSVFPHAWSGRENGSLTLN